MKALCQKSTSSAAAWQAVRPRYYLPNGDRSRNSRDAARAHDRSPQDRRLRGARLQQLLQIRDPKSAPGMLKAEMMAIGSLVLETAAVAAVPGGQALAVDRDVFAKK